MSNCWSESANDRPDMHEVASSVLDIADQFAIEEQLIKGKRMRRSLTMKLNLPRRGSLF
jgi:hypothetical protein